MFTSAYNLFGGVNITPLPPTLVLAPAPSPITPISEQVMIRDSLPGARIAVVEGRSHEIYVDDPEALHQRIIQIPGPAKLGQRREVMANTRSSLRECAEEFGLVNAPGAFSPTEVTYSTPPWKRTQNESRCSARLRSGRLKVP